jgi:hypothetical protein
MQLARPYMYTFWKNESQYRLISRFETTKAVCMKCLSVVPKYGHTSNVQNLRSLMSILVIPILYFVIMLAQVLSFDSCRVNKRNILTNAKPLFNLHYYDAV